MPNHSDESAETPVVAPAIESGTVAVIRDAEAGGIEVLMLRRAPLERDTFSGMWVFPGGKVDEADRAGGADERGAARIAAVREAAEEADIELSPESLHPMDRWEPEARPEVTRRFSAWIFMAPAGEGVVTTDGTEIHDHEWVSPSEAIRRHAAGIMGIVPPTWISLLQLSEHDSVASAMEWVRNRTPEDFYSRLTEVDGETILIWHGDELSGGGEGDRHRLAMVPGAWRYERNV